MGSPLPVKPNAAASILTLDRFCALAPHALGPHGEDQQAIHAALVQHASTYALDAPAPLAMFLAQVGHESQGFTRWEENLRYSADRLMAVFGSRHVRSVADARQLSAGGPKAIAERVYGGRMGNGPEGSGDGYRYRGRGLIGLTGASNYKFFGTTLGLPLLSCPELAGELDEGTRIACCFFAIRTVGFPVDDVESVTKRINGGVNGLRDRRERYALACEVLKVTA